MTHKDGIRYLKWCISNIDNSLLEDKNNKNALVYVDSAILRLQLLKRELQAKIIIDNAMNMGKTIKGDNDE
jgi:hypothetical protein